MSPTIPGSAWEKAYCESFNSRFRDNFQNLEEIASELEAKVLSAEWKSAHRKWRPDSALDADDGEVRDELADSEARKGQFIRISAKRL